MINNQVESFITNTSGSDNQHTLDYHLNERLPLKIDCAVHPWEKAYLLIKNHPYFAITDDKGAFTIKNLPVGDWEFQLWHEKPGYLVAKEEWKKGRIKMKIEPGKNDLGEIKVAPQLFED
ncbi:hypothetical protein [uncultured Gimesia sp.]|uniref:hypothetical protein n=1 Tax=uncultured Gimesia sp. TaxID=1678688 RepID=UPI0026033C8E|nr:hypothetical protein [uncultured Gimesia sp.]